MPTLAKPILAMMGLTAPTAVQAFETNEDEPSSLMQAQPEFQTSEMSDLYQTRFVNEDVDGTEAEWDLIAESVHIAFMQQDAVRLQVSELSGLADAELPLEEA